MDPQKITTINTPKVAVLLAAYNGEKYLEEQILSILNQREVSVHIFISIDQSTDKTLDICQSLQTNFKNISVLDNNKNKFGSAGKNFYHLLKTVSFENFDFIALSDQDDIWKECKLIHGIQILNSQSCDGYSSDVECFWDNGRKSRIIKKSYPQKKYDYFFESAGPGCTYILTKKLAECLKKNLLLLTDPPFHHDWFIYAFARKNNFKWTIDTQSLLLYRQHSTNQVGANIGFKSKIKRIKKLQTKIYKKDVEKLLISISIEEKTIQNLRKDIIKNPFNFRRKNSEALFLIIFNLLGWI